MDYDFSRGQVRRCVTTSDEGMTLEGPEGQLRLTWDQVTGAGVGVKRPTGLINRLPVDKPQFAGLATAVSLASQVRTATDLLYIAYLPVGKVQRLYTLAIPTGGEVRDDLLTELARRLGARWIVEPMDMLDMRRRLGFANWWVAPGLMLVLLLAILAVAFWWLAAGRFG
jgi:hypothetical protein